MDLETFRAIDVEIDLANDFVPDVILSANDYNGRCIVARVTNGGVSVSGDNLSARLLFNTAPGISAGGYVTMTRVASSPTATWQVPVPSDALAARQVMLCVQIVDSDDNLVCSRNFRGIVDRKLMDDDAPESVNELNQLWEGIDALENIDASVTADGTVSVTAPDGTVTTSTAVPAAVSAANSATSAANTAATAANTAATAASTAADDANAAAARAEEAARPTEEMFASYHALLKAGASEGIASDANPVQSSFLRRTSGSAEGVRDGIATIECIKGNTVGWNQLVDGMDSSSADGITSSYDASTHLFKIVNDTRTSNYTTGSSRAYIVSNVLTIIGHKILVKTDAPTGVCTGYYSDTAPLNNIPNNTVFTLVSNTGLFLRITNQYDFVTLHPVGDVTTFHMCVFDLTTMFGAGNEPATVEEFEALYPLFYYEYNPGTLKPVMFEGIETVGFNQWDEEWELGTVSGANGGNSTSTDSIRSKNYIPVLPNTTYNISIAEKTANWTLVEYDADKNYIGWLLWGGALKTGWEFTTSANARYVRFSTNTVNTAGTMYGPTYKNDINFNLKWSGYRDGEYEEYWKAQREIAIAEHFPTGMKAAGTAADALYKDHADHVIGSVDLGTLTWAYNSTDEYFQASDLSPTASIPATQWIVPNIKCAKYIVKEAFYVINKELGVDKSITIANRTQVRVRDSAYTDVASFKAAMSGVMLYYELATPTTEVIDPPLNLGYKVSDFGTERVMLGDGVISAPPIFEISYGYTAESLRDAAASIVAPVENHLAQDNYAIGSYLVRNGVLYKVTAAIARNEAIVPGTNVTATTVMAEIAAING